MDLTTMLTVSVAHIKRETMDMLDMEDRTGDMGLTVYRMCDGCETESWLVYADANADGDVPDDLQKLMELCEEKRIDWLRIDECGEILPGFPVYEGNGNK